MSRMRFVYITNVAVLDRLKSEIVKKKWLYMTIKKYETHISHVGMLLEEFQEEVTSNKSICGTSIPEIVPTELSKL